uniref:Uncharacterized protein n=1 Tax=Candidatus Methanophaga sp. ANME-1 ERB7 TaxID=2759913 RepID=A0A7G9ZBE8_9EURY|nr:hypothetical protein MFOBGCIO_00010 [Methanosarcinales archaeon ANME-1 ERB7]
MNSLKGRSTGIVISNQKNKIEKYHKIKVNSIIRGMIIGAIISMAMTGNTRRFGWLA